MRTTAKVDYAVRAAVALARAEAEATARGETVEPTKSHLLAAGEEIPPKFLESILADLKRAHVVTSRRGAVGGYRLGRPAEEITVADVIRAVEGPLATVRGEQPDEVSYEGAATGLGEVWVALRTNVRSVLENVSLADVLAGELPARARPDARSPGTPGRSSR
jgi:Rrf2 family protein